MQAIKPPGEFKDDITGIATFLYKLNLLGAHLFFTEFNIGVIFNAISLNGTLQRFLLSVVNRAVSNLIISHLYDEWFETIFEAYKYHADVSSSKFNLISPELKSSTSPSVIEKEEAKENPLIFVLYYFVAKGFSGLIENACKSTENPLSSSNST